MKCHSATSFLIRPPGPLHTDADAQLPDRTEAALASAARPGPKRRVAKSCMPTNPFKHRREKAIYDAGQRLVISGKRDGNNTSCLRKRENEDLPTHCKTEYQSMNPSKGDQASEMSIERKSNKLLLFATCIVILVHYLAFSPWQLSWDSEITSLQTSPSREITSSETLYVKELIGPALVLSISSQCMVTNGCQPPHRYNQ